MDFNVKKSLRIKDLSDSPAIGAALAIGAKRPRIERKEAYSYFPYVVAVKSQVMNREVLYYI